MGRKLKYTKEQKIWACEQYLNKTLSTLQIATILNMSEYGHDLVLKWSGQYKKYGPAVFDAKLHNKAYTADFKIMVVKDHLKNGLSTSQLAVKYNIPSDSTVCSWISKYNNHEEIKDYKPCPEVCMANRVKSTAAQRQEVVKWCLENDKNYREAASRFGFSYGQVYSWTKKYLESGEKGLTDNRGKRKEEDELTEIERLQRKLRLSEAKVESLERENYLLKKLKNQDWGW